MSRLFDIKATVLPNFKQQRYNELVFGGRMSVNILISVSSQFCDNSFESFFQYDSNELSNPML